MTNGKIPKARCKQVKTMKPTKCYMKKIKKDNKAKIRTSVDFSKVVRIEAKRYQTARKCHLVVVNLNSTAPKSREN